MVASERAAVQWKELYDFISICGEAHNPKNLAINILNGIGRLCPFDQALVYFIDGNRNICGQYLMNIDASWSNMYLGYYANTEDHKYSYNTEIREEPHKVVLRVKDWENETSTEFVPKYIQARGLKYSCGFALFDLNGNYRTIISLDRVTKREFSEAELELLRQLIPQINNLHKNFYYQGFILNAMKHETDETEKLTTREAEIANLLCQGVSAANISRTLYIAQSTTYKHIANIYEKLHVSSQQELLVCLLRKPEPIRI